MMRSFVFIVTGLLLGIGTTVWAQTYVFPDVTLSDWFGPYVNEIKDWGVVSGNDDGTFAPDRNINRAEFSKMLVLYDERVDQKITDQVSAGSMSDTSDTSEPEPEAIIPEPAPTVMYLQENNPSSVPPACPENWESVDVQQVYNHNNDNSVRTCMTNQACEVMYLESRQMPAVCPEGWSEAAYGELNIKNNQRVCFACAN